MDAGSLANLDPVIGRAWAEALESGYFRQTKKRLYSEGCHCATGVLVELAVKAGILKRFPVERAVLDHETRRWAGNIGAAGYLPTPVHYDGHDCHCIAQLNDRGMPFKDIAKVIRSYLPPEPTTSRITNEDLGVLGLIALLSILWWSIYLIGVFSG